MLKSSPFFLKRIHNLCGDKVYVHKEGKSVDRLLWDWYTALRCVHNKRDRIGSWISFGFCDYLLWPMLSFWQKAKLFKFRFLFFSMWNMLVMILSIVTSLPIMRLAVIFFKAGFSKFILLFEPSKRLEIL